VNIYYKQSDITAPLSELMLSPWALEGDGTRAAGIQEALHLIQDIINGEVPENMKIPVADVVEVVRCKDCRFCMEFKDKSDGFYGHCRIWLTRVISDYAALVNADSYCSYGEYKKG